MNPAFGTFGFGTGGFGNQPIENLPIGYYLGTLTSEYRNSPKLNALLSALLQKFEDVSRVLVKLDTALDIDSAVGPQLDLLGGIVNAQRTVPFTPSNGVSATLDDDTYRLYIKAKAARNLWDGTIDGLQATWQILFPQFTIAILDNQNMTMTVFISGTISSILADLIRNGFIVPRPEGVLANYVLGNLPAFGFGSIPGFIAGFGVGKWA